MSGRQQNSGLDQDISKYSRVDESLPVLERLIGPVGLSLRTNFSWTFAGNVIYSACQWGILVALAKLGSPEAVGQFALGLAVTAPVLMFTNLQLGIILATDARRQYQFGDYLSLRYLTSALAFLVIVGIAYISNYRLQTVLVILAIGASKVFDSVGGIYCSLLQQHEKMDRIAISGMIKGLLSLTVLGVLFYTTRSVFWASVGLAAVSLLVLASYDMRGPGVIIRILRRSDCPEDSIREMEQAIRLRWNSKALRNLTVLSLPLGFVMLLISLNANIPRYFIEHYIGERSLGIFAAMAYLMVAGTTVISALAESAVPRMAKYYASGNAAAFQSLLLRLSGIGALIGCAGVAVAVVMGRWLLTILYRPEYAAHNNVFVWIAAASAFLYVQWFLGNGMTAARYFRVQVPLLGTVVIVTALSCYWLIPLRGLSGAAYTLMIANIVLTLGTLWVDIAAISRLKRQNKTAEEKI